MANVLSVSSANIYAKSILDENKFLSDIAVEGEISGFVNHYKSGHYYFSLKDENASIKTVMFSFNNKKLTFLPENGMKVIIRGKISIYEKDGTYQLYASDMFKNGLGLQHIAFEKLKEKLADEGLFDSQHKKALPKYPFNVGIVTSMTGAALQDIISVHKRRFPCARLTVSNCTVQGDHAKSSIISAIKALDAIMDIEVIIIARGGGSKEDMWVFNDEDIARAAYECKKPLISAVGHEIDFTILDFVADVRAATPTAASELALPDIESLSYQILNFEENITAALKLKVKNSEMRLTYYKNSKAFSSITALCEKNLYKINIYQEKLAAKLIENIEDKKKELYYIWNILENQNPLNNLKKGFSITHKGEELITAETLITENDKITIRTYNKLLECTVNSIKEVGNINE